MFDTLRQSNGLGFSLAQCGNHKSRAENAKQHFLSLEAQIPQLEKRLLDFETGTQQKLYAQMEDKQNQLRVQIGELEVQNKQLTLVRDAWQTNPEVQANAEGLGFSLRSIGNFVKRNVKSIARDANNVVSCDRYTNEQAEWERKSTPLSNRVTELNTKIGEISNRLSPTNMKAQESAMQNLQMRVNELIAKNNALESQIVESRQAYKLRKEQERAALEQEAREREAQLKEVEAERKNPKKGNATLLIGGLIAAGVVGYMVMGKKKGKKATA